MTVSPKLRQKIRRDAKQRCGYCLSQQAYLPAPLEIEHIIPKSKGGQDDEENLWLACRSCNLFKSNHTQGQDPISKKIVPLFNPRQQSWDEHFLWSSKGIIIEGKTPCGRATVVRLQLNNIYAITVRKNWIIAGWHPPV